MRYLIILRQARRSRSAGLWALRSLVLLSSKRRKRIIRMKTMKRTINSQCRKKTRMKKATKKRRNKKNKNKGEEERTWEIILTNRFLITLMWFVT